MVDEVFVLEEARELGFGDALVEEIQRIGRQRGAQRMEAEALPGDRDTKNLWERAGITARLITVSVEL
jgi:GNAT superfamily N-acetyltransferase